MFYTYSQNSSGGRFVFNEDVNYYVVIEADSSNEADTRAEEVGVYFDGCDSGRDCDCCGDRWSRSWSQDGTETPMIYDEPVQTYWKNAEFKMKWADNQAIIVYFKDGRKEIHYV